MHLQSNKVIKALLFFSIWGIGISLNAEKILLKNGRAIYGSIVEQNNEQIKVISRLGEIIIANSQIAEISQEEEPQILPIIPKSSSPKDRSKKDFFQIQLLYGWSNWRGGDLKVFADQSFDYWNSVGEIERYLGESVEKARIPNEIGVAANWGMRILKKSGLLQIGISLSRFKNSFANRVSINDQKFIDSFNLSGNQIALVIGTPILQPIQMIGRIEIGGNFSRLEYASEYLKYRESHFYPSLLLANGAAFKLNQVVSITAEIGYFFAFPPVWKNMGISYSDEGFHGFKRPVIAAENARSLKPNLNGLCLNAGISFSVNRLLRTIENEPDKED